MEQETFIARLMRKQWSLSWAGVTFGIVQIIYMVALRMQAWNGHGQLAWRFARIDL